MKKAVITGFLIAIISICNAQSIVYLQEPGYRQHTGFYLSLSVGPNFPSITSEIPGISNFKFTGTGAQFDIKIGGAVKENLILHATLISNALAGPKVTSSGISQKISNNVSIGEAMFGGGITYYIMPANFFLSGSVGLGNYTVMAENNANSISTNRGFSMQLKIGKEWWVSKRWGLGIAATYGKTKLTNSPGGRIEEFMNSNNLGILFNATLN